VLRAPATYFRMPLTFGRCSSPRFFACAAGIDCGVMMLFDRMAGTSSFCPKAAAAILWQHVLVLRPPGLHSGAAGDGITSDLLTFARLRLFGVS
jgi:hypothetical protein